MYLRNLKIELEFRFLEKWIGIFTVLWRCICGWKLPPILSNNLNNQELVLLQYIGTMVGNHFWRRIPFLYSCIFRKYSFDNQLFILKVHTKIWNNHPTFLALLSNVLNENFGLLTMWTLLLFLINVLWKNMC